MRKQPVHKGVDERGEIIWEYQAMELWQEIMLYAKPYIGEFLWQWQEHKMMQMKSGYHIGGQ